ncbi:MAG TPA: peptidylprolyl isomerase [Fimbriimonadaceae bacterium]|nr:peptidylprolyl isomerase [Fimbriimonadaceae bacterium]
MLRYVMALTLLALGALAFSQYSPKAGETVMRLNLAGGGQIDILLHTKEAPKATAQVIGLAQRGFYDGQRFFRVVKKPRPFLIQFGDPGSKTKPMDDKTLGEGGSGSSVDYEDSGFPNVAGAVGLATKKDDKDSGDSQFYILLSDSRFLNGSATVFGKVVSSMADLNKIALGDKVTSVTIVRG